MNKMDKCTVKKKCLEEERRLIMEMIDASMELAHEKGPHDMTPGCNCIVCINKRKQKMFDSALPWRFKI